MRNGEYLYHSCRGRTGESPGRFMPSHLDHRAREALFKARAIVEDCRTFRELTSTRKKEQTDDYVHAKPDIAFRRSAACNASESVSYRRTRFSRRGNAAYRECMGCVASLAQRKRD